MKIMKARLFEKSSKAHFKNMPAKTVKFLVLLKNKLSEQFGRREGGNRERKLAAKLRMMIWPLRVKRGEV